MINIQKSYSVHIISIRSILSSLIHFSSIWFILPSKVLFGLFNTHWLYLVHIGPILSTSVLSVHIVPIRSTLVLFCPLQSFRSILSTLVLSVHYILFGLFYPLWSNSVLFGPFSPLWFYLVHFVHLGSIRSILFTSVHYVHFRSIRSIHSYLVLFGPPCFYSIHSVLFSPFGPLCSIWSNSIHLDLYFNLFLCTYIMEKNMFGLKAFNLNPNLLQ